VAILLALGFGDHRSEAQELVEAYLASMGLDRLKPFMRPGPQGAAPGPNVGAVAARSAVQKSTIQLTLEQWQLLAKDFEAHTCETLLANTRGGMDPSTISRITKLSPAAVKRAVKALAAVGLVKVAKGRIRCILDDKTGETPPKSPAMLAAKAAMARQFERWGAQGRSEGNYLINVRLTRANLDQFKQQIDYTLDLAELLSNQQSGDDSAVYMVQTRIVDLFPRDR